jgi:hypothetical protein
LPKILYDLRTRRDLYGLACDLVEFVEVAASIRVEPESIPHFLWRERTLARTAAHFGLTTAPPQALLWGTHNAAAGLHNERVAYRLGTLVGGLDRPGMGLRVLDEIRGELERIMDRWGWDAPREWGLRAPGEARAEGRLLVRPFGPDDPAASLTTGEHARLRRLIARLERRLARLPTRRPPAPGYLGLIVDPDRRAVGRQGTDRRVGLARRPLWALFLKLYRARDRYRGPESLLIVWERSGQELSPSLGTIRDAVSDLRRALAPLGVDVATARGFGWRLEARPAPDGSPDRS